MDVVGSNNQIKKDLINISCTNIIKRNTPDKEAGRIQKEIENDLSVQGQKSDDNIANYKNLNYKFTEKCNFHRERICQVKFITKAKSLFVINTNLKQRLFVIGSCGKSQTYSNLSFVSLRK